MTGTGGRWRSGSSRKCAAVLVPRIGLLGRMPRYQLVVRHSAYPDLEDDEAGTELPNDAAAREFAAKVMRGLVHVRPSLASKNPGAEQGFRA
jgi:hypothetical protein